MKRKYQIILIIIILIILTFTSGITYSLFTSGTRTSINNLNVAKFIFNAQKLDQLELPLTDLKPSDNQEYLFSISNNYTSNRAQVSIEYQLTIKTFHLIPITINLYLINDNEEKLVLTCDETYTRNTNNEIVCNTTSKTLIHSEDQTDNYKLKINFPSSYNTEEYANLVDYINIEIKSQQK